MRDLSPASPGDDITLDFSIRVRHSATPDDVEDASLWWTRPLDRTVPIAKIKIPRQDFLTRSGLRWRAYDVQPMEQLAAAPPRR